MSIPNFIEVYKNAFDTEFCDEVIKVFEEASTYNMTLSRQTHDNSPKLKKEDEAIFIPGFQEFPLSRTNKKIIEYFNKIFWEKCYKKYAEKYSILDNLSPHTIYEYKIQKTKPGQGYHIWHCETDGRQSSSRLLAWTAYMNDNFEAGETEFLYQQYRYKPSKGDLVIFPATFTHVHRGNPPIGGDKYIITGWVEF